MLLVLNAGSSSVKMALFDMDLNRLNTKAVTGISAGGHQGAVAALLADIDPAALSVCAHRVVHGGAELTKSCRISETVFTSITAAIPLAPLHNPANLAGISAMRAMLPKLPQYACFDTGFHAQNPSHATRFAIPAPDHARGIRRYGFHGISYAGLVAKVQEIAENTPVNRLLGLHLGNGASLCAIYNGQSVATTMGYSPNDGLTMGTRSGGIDAAAVLALARIHGIDGAEAVLNHRSGLLALGGSNDMRILSQSPQGNSARNHFAYWAVRHAGSMIAAMGGLDAVAFTGGIGENDAGIRAQIMAGLAFMGLRFDAAANTTHARDLHDATSPIRAHIIPADEERSIAQAARKLFQNGD